MIEAAKEIYAACSAPADKAQLYSHEDHLLLEHPVVYHPIQHGKALLTHLHPSCADCTSFNKVLVQGPELLRPCLWLRR